MTSGRQLAEDDAEEQKKAEEKDKPFWVPPSEHFAAFAAFQRDKSRKDRQKELALPVHKKVASTYPPSLKKSRVKERKRNKNKHI